MTLGGCVTPLPAIDPQQAWIDLDSLNGRVILAERLDNVRLSEGRFFQVSPGAHELLIRFDFEIYSAGGGRFDPMGDERLCYLTMHYDAFEAGQRYRLEARSLGLRPMARLYNSRGQQIAEDSEVDCLL